MQASGAVEKWKHEQWKHALWNDQSHSLMGEFGIGRCQENIYYIETTIWGSLLE